MITNALIILDGFGYRNCSEGNAVSAAGTPFFDYLKANYPHTLIQASGRAVGLPQGQMGSSEVGHLNLGAGRVVYQDITRINKSIEDGQFDTNPAFVGAIDNVRNTSGALHLVGLLGNGGVHSSISHLFALLEMAARSGVRTYIHAITDGRDTARDSARAFIADTQAKLKGIGADNASIATICGRYFYMDRDNRWDRVKIGYDCVFAAEGEHYNSADEAIGASYAEGTFDEFVSPKIIGDYKGVRDGDSVIFYNFRSDRAREISHAITEPDFDKFERKGGYKRIYYAGMTEYDVTLNGIHTAFAPKRIDNTLGEYLASAGLTQARIAETEKYAHVTFFFNGGVEAANAGEQRVLVPSPKVATYDLVPQMSAYEVADKAVQVVGNVDVLILNFANCDMVGHTGVYSAAVEAVKAVDNCLSKVVQAVIATGGSCIVTADHGNAETMFTVDGKPMTEHTTNPVPLVVVSEKLRGTSLREGGALCDVAPTLLQLIGLPRPSQMEGTSLIK